MHMKLKCHPVRLVIICGIKDHTWICWKKVQVKSSGRASCEEGAGATPGRERATQKSRAGGNQQIQEIETQVWRGRKNTPKKPASQREQSALHRPCKNWAFNHPGRAKKRQKVCAVFLSLLLWPRSAWSNFKKNWSRLIVWGMLAQFIMEGEICNGRQFHGSWSEHLGLLTACLGRTESRQGLGTDYKTSVSNLKDPLPPVEVRFL